MNHFRNEGKKKNIHDELSLDQEDKFIYFLNSAIRIVVKALALLMMLTVLWCVLDVVVVIYKEILSQPITLLGKSEILHVFGSFTIVLIAVEIFINISIHSQRRYTGENGGGDSANGSGAEDYCFRFP